MRRHVGKKSHRIVERKSPKQRGLLRGVDNSKDIDLILSKYKLNQDLLGFTSDYLSQLFEQAVGLLQQHRFDEAVKAFELLTQLNPYVPDFWIGIGLAHQACESYRPALSAFLVAETMDPSRIDPYSYAVDCCLEMKDMAQAEAIVEQALRWAKKHSHRTSTKDFLHELSIIKKHIKDEKKASQVLL